MSAKVHTLDPIHPEIHFTRGANVTVSKRNVRMYEGKLCVSARGALYAITPTGPRVATCDLSAPALIDFGSRKAAREQAQSVAPVVTLAKLGVKRPAKPAVASKPATDDVAELRAQVADLAAMVAAFVTHES